jgi:hypothetical protein
MQEVIAGPLDPLEVAELQLILLGSNNPLDFYGLPRVTAVNDQCLYSGVGSGDAASYMPTLLFGIISCLLVQEQSIWYPKRFASITVIASVDTFVATSEVVSSFPYFTSKGRQYLSFTIPIRVSTGFCYFLYPEVVSRL